MSLSIIPYHFLTSSSAEQQAKESVPSSKDKSFFDHIRQAGLIDSEGKLVKEAVLPEMIPLEGSSMRRLETILKSEMTFHAFDQQKTKSCKDFLLKLNLKEGRILLVGGIVHWILGSEGLFKAASILAGGATLKGLKESLSSFDQLKGDVDVRYVPNVKKDPQMIAEELLINLTDSFKSTGKSVSDIFDELRKTEGPFKLFHPFLDIDEGELERHAFRINYNKNQGFDLDLMIATLLKFDTLLSLQDLTLDITDYLLNKTRYVYPSGKSGNGWQAIIALVEKVIQLEAANPHAWARAQSKKIIGYKALTPYPQELYQKIKPRSLRGILQRVANGHIKSHPAASCMLLLDCASDLLQHGFHQTDVEHITDCIKIEGSLSPQLEALKNARKKIPLEVILAALRFINYPSPDWMMDGFTSTIQMSIEQAIEILIRFENRSEDLIQFYECFGLSVETKTRATLRLVEKRCSEYLEHACSVYFKGREEDADLVHELVSLLFFRDFKKAVQFFKNHLKFVKQVENSHLILFDKIVKKALQEEASPETIHTIVSIAKLFNSSSKGLKEVLKKAIYSLLEKKPVLGSYMLKACVEAQIILVEPELWFQAVKSLFYKRENDAIKLWGFAERQGIKFETFEKDHVYFIIDFIDSLYRQNTLDCLRLGDRLQGHLPLMEYEYSEKLNAIREKKKTNHLEYEAAEEDLKGKFAYLEQCQEINPLFKETFSKAIRGISLSQPNINKINRLIKRFNNEFERDFDLNHTLLLLIESAFNAGFSSVPLLEIFEVALGRDSLEKLAIDLLMTGMRNQLLHSSTLRKCLSGRQESILNECLKSQLIVEAVSFINFLNGDLSSDRPFLFNTCLRTVISVLKDHQISLVETRTLLHQLKDKFHIQEFTHEESLILIELVEALQASNFVVESAFWMQLLIKNLSLNLTTKTLTWISHIAAQGSFQEASVLLEQLTKAATENSEQVFSTMMDMAVEVLTASSPFILTHLKGRKDVSESFHLSEKINRLIGLLIKEENPSLAIDFLDQGFSGLPDSTYPLLNQSLRGSSDLALRSWSFFRIRFKDYILEDAYDTEITKCLRVSKTILNKMVSQKMKKAVPFIDGALKIYFEKLNEILKVKSKSSEALEDLLSLLVARLQLTNEEELFSFIKKVIELRGRLLSHPKLRKKLNKDLYPLEEILSSKLLTQKGNLFIQGLSIFHHLMAHAPGHTTNIANLMLLALNNAPKEQSFDKLEYKGLISEIIDFYWNMNPGKENIDRITKALLNDEEEVDFSKPKLSNKKRQELYLEADRELDRRIQEEDYLRCEKFLDNLKMILYVVLIFGGIAFYTHFLKKDPKV